MWFNVFVSQISPDFNKRVARWLVENNRIGSSENLELIKQEIMRKNCYADNNV